MALAVAAPGYYAPTTASPTTAANTTGNYWHHGKREAEPEAEPLAEAHSGYFDTTEYPKFGYGYSDTTEYPNNYWG